MNRYKDDQNEFTEAKSCDQSTAGTQIRSSPGFGNERQERLNDAMGDQKVAAVDSNPTQQSWKKPNDMPKRPMCAYNLFYQLERERIVEGGQPRKYTSDDINRIIDRKKQLGLSPQPKRKHRRTHGKISFADLARLTAKNWKSLDDEARAPFHERAEIEKKIYKEEIKAWNASKDPELKHTGKKRRSISSTAGISVSSLAQDSAKSDVKRSSDYDVQVYQHNISTTNEAIGILEESFLELQKKSAAFLQSDLSPYLRSRNDSGHSSDELPVLGDNDGLNRLRSLSDITEDLTSSNRRSAHHHTDFMNEQLQASYALNASTNQTARPQFARMPTNTNVALTYGDPTSLTSRIQNLTPTYMQELPQSNQILSQAASYVSRPEHTLVQFGSQQAASMPPLIHNTNVRANASNMQDTFYQHQDSATRIRAPDFVTPRSSLSGRGSHVEHPQRAISMPVVAQYERFPSSINHSQFLSNDQVPHYPQRSHSIALQETVSTSEQLQHHRWSYPGRTADFSTTATQDAPIGYAVETSQTDTFASQHQFQPQNQPHFFQSLPYVQTNDNRTNINNPQLSHQNRLDMYVSHGMPLHHYTNQLQLKNNSVLSDGQLQFNNNGNLLNDGRNMRNYQFSGMHPLPPQLFSNTAGGEVTNSRVRYNESIQPQNIESIRRQEQQQGVQLFDVSDAPGHEDENNHLFDY